MSWDCETLEVRQLLASVPVVKGWWEGTFDNSLQGSGFLVAQLKQDGKKVTGTIWNSDGIKYKLNGRIDGKGVIRGAFMARGVFSGTLKGRVRGFETPSTAVDYIKGRYEGDGRERAVAGRFRMEKD
jgi:hypothetical protein